MEQTLNFDVVGFTLTVGLIGSSFLLGIVARSLGVRETFTGTGIWTLAMAFILAAVSFLSALRPVLQPLWLQYLLLDVLPFAVGFIGLSLLIGRRPAVDEEQAPKPGSGS